MIESEKILKDILLELKRRHSQQWKQYEPKTLEVFSIITKLLLSEEKPPIKEIIKLINQLPPEVNKMLYYIHRPGYYSKSHKINILRLVLTDKSFKEFIEVTVKAKEFDNDTEKILKAKMENIKIPDAEVGLSIISTWASIVNPNLFMPIHGYVTSREFREIAERIFKIQLVYGGGWRKHISDYLEFLKKINQIKPDLGINTTFEIAFYLSKFSRELLEKQKFSQKERYYLEVTKPPGKPYLENHIGRFLWSPADKRYWNGREGKIGMLEIGDIIIHDVKGKIVGYSKVAEKPKVVSKEEIIKIFNEEGIWSEKYSEFAKEWFKKSPNEKFYLVKLRDFQILPKKFGYTKLSSLPHPASIQGVYLTEINPKVLEELGIIHEITNNKSQGIQLSEYLISQGYLYPPHLVSQFYTALKTKGFVILSGLTGTGKTKITQELAELLDDSKNNLLFLSVRPDWRDSKALLGYYNPLTGEYQRTQLLDFILKAIADYDKNRENAMPYFVILDEMNLAHVEYYFADFLSVLESGRDENGFTREPIPLHEVEEVEKEQEIPRELKLPPNLYIIGTVNMDETTYSFSPKVLDRAFVVEFHDVDLENYPPQDSESEPSPETIKALRDSILTDLRGEENKFLARSKEEANKAVRALKGTEYWRVLVELNGALEPYDMHFGYRVVDEIALFFQSAKESRDKGIVEFRDDDEIFDLALLMKVLPKFHGNRKKLEEPLKVILVECLRQENNSPVKFRVSFTERANTKTLELPTDIDKLNSEAIIEMLTNWEKYENNFRFKHTARKVLRMLRQLYEIGFASFS